MPAEERKAFVAKLLPTLRGKLSVEHRKVAHFSDAPEVLDFVNSERAAELAALGTSCPDHFLRTKIKPLFVAERAGADRLQATIDELDPLLASYREDYAAYYERCKRPNSPAMRDPYPVVILLPGIGMLTLAKDKPMAAAGQRVLHQRGQRDARRDGSRRVRRVARAGGVQHRVLAARGSQAASGCPPEKSLSRQVALVTGGAGGIGKATAARMLRERACVVLCDVDDENLERAGKELQGEFGKDFVRWIRCDVTDEASVLETCAFASREFGGIDVVVCCAGLASAEPFESTSLELWQKNIDVLATGYFMVAREGFRVMKEQGRGGSIVFIASKNAMAASPNASAYCTAKAGAVHLARCIALEGAPHGIRCNTVNPDAVLRGSKIWRGDWRKERAETYGIAEDQLEEHYRKRSLLGREVLPEDIAEAVYFFAQGVSAKSTGNILNVDAGNAGRLPEVATPAPPRNDPRPADRPGLPAGEQRRSAERAAA